jgi:hypothetical protein
MTRAEADATHAPCPICAKPVKVIARPPQPHRHLANHGEKLGVLCRGAGMLVDAEKSVDKPAVAV